MVHSRPDADELPSELEDELKHILEADDEARRPSFNDSDEFDASALLSQPFFDDSNGDLNVDESEFANMQASRGLASSGDNMNTDSNMNQLQSNFQQQSNFSSYDASTVTLSSNLPIHQMNIFSSVVGSTEPEELINRTLSPEQTLNLKVQEVQRKIEQVQQQIERAQLESANSGMPSPLLIPNSLSTLQQQSQGIQNNNFDMQALTNHASVIGSRAPPGRSVSMPIRRNQMHGSPLNHQPAFMMQQPMQELLRQQAMIGNSQGSSVRNGIESVQGFTNQGSPMDHQQQQNMMLGNSVDIVGSSPMRNMQNFIQIPSLDQQQQQQAMIGGSGDVSVTSAMNNMQGLDIGVGVSMDGSMNSSMSNMQQNSMSNMGFNPDNSVQSMPTSMPNGMFMMQQQQGMDDMMPNVVFGADGQPMRQNSLPHANSSNIAVMQGQSHNDLIAPANFDLAQIQRAFQAQGLIPGPAGSASGQQPMGQTGQSNQQGMSMEKLCESMRRSAMSRSLVKQLSGRTLSRASSGRGLTKTQSGRNLPRQNSGGIRRQAASGANAGRLLQRSASGRQTTMMAENGVELPVRRAGQDSKHRIQRDALSSSSLHTPRQGIFRHKSQSAALGGTNQKTVVNIDGNTVGMF